MNSLQIAKNVPKYYRAIIILLTRHLKKKIVSPKVCLGNWKAKTQNVWRKLIINETKGHHLKDLNCHAKEVFLIRIGE